jgi:hypothetical protein
MAEGRESYGLLAIQQCTYSCHNKREISWLNKQLSASEGLCHMQLPSGSVGRLVSQQSAVCKHTISTIQYWISEIAVTDGMAGA